jgi:hypothetical protein
MASTIKTSSSSVVSTHADASVVSTHADACVVSTPVAPGVEEIRFIFPAPPPIVPYIERQIGINCSEKTYQNKECTFISNEYDMKDCNIYNV